MKQFKILLITLLISSTAQLFAQKSVENLIGKWQTEDNTILEISKTGSSTIIKQMSTLKEKEKKNNGKIIAKELAYVKGADYKGIVIDVSNNKEYNAVFSLALDGKSLNLKVKWGIMSFNETWKKL
jgi:uncharacterized protein (DUF2147 family)